MPRTKMAGADEDDLRTQSLNLLQTREGESDTHLDRSLRRQSAQTLGLDDQKGRFLTLLVGRALRLCVRFSFEARNDSLI